MKKGFDISSWQKGLKIETLSPDFMIMRAGFGDAGIKKDPCVDGFVKQCETLGVPYGLYFYGDAHSVDDVKKELDKFEDIAKKYNATLGLFYDLEGKMLSNSNEINRDIITEVKSRGIGLYASSSFMRTISSRYPDIFFGCALWVACWGSSACPSIAGNIKFWQYKVDTMPNGSERIDYDYMIDSASPVNPTPVLKMGSVGEAVQKLQDELNEYFAGAYTLKLDGVFGDKTRRGVIAVQALGGLIIDGIVGVKTWEYLTSGKKS